MFDQPLLGPAPESLHAVDVHLAGGEIFAVVHLQMAVIRKTSDYRSS